MNSFVPKDFKHSSEKIESLSIGILEANKIVPNEQIKQAIVYTRLMYFKTTMQNTYPPFYTFY